jgi:4'-phosphopantetheinyl transferase
MEVHVWRLKVSDGASVYARERLSQEEQERADRFRQREDRWRFTVGRAALRSILGEYQGLDARSLCFIYNEAGKPALAPSCNPTGLSFNAAHSGEYALVACGSGLALGVDIEHLAVTRDIDLVAKSLLPAADFARHLLKPSELRKRDVLQEWTRREAVGKALGRGISAALSDYEAVLADPVRWSIREIDVGEDYVAALAAQTAGLQLYLYEP